VTHSKEIIPLNKSSSRIIQYSGVFLLSLFVSYLVFSFVDWDQNIEQAENKNEAEGMEQDIDTVQAAVIQIVGDWQSEPILGQLGVIQSSYTFNAEGSYSNKLDMISFCEEQYGQDCEYFWKVFSGKYSVEDEVITLSAIEDKTVKLGKGQSKPDIRIDAEFNPQTNEYMVKLDAGNLVMTGIKDNESVTYRPFVAIEQDEITSSDAAHDIEQNTDILGEWQSEPHIVNSMYIQSSYTFNTDESYLYTMEFLRLCKDVPEQNCEYYRMSGDGTYTIKDGVIILREFNL